jgi:hypothetical protein
MPRCYRGAFQDFTAALLACVRLRAFIAASSRSGGRHKPKGIAVRIRELGNTALQHPPGAGRGNVSLLAFGWIDDRDQGSTHGLLGKQ